MCCKTRIEKICMRSSYLSAGIDFDCQSEQQMRLFRIRFLPFNFILTVYMVNLKIYFGSFSVPHKINNLNKQKN